MRSCPRCRSLYSPQVDRCLDDGERLIDERGFPLVGHVLDRYRIVEPIGEGAMGCVYRAAHAVLPREYAVKVLFRDLASNQTLIERFRREAQAVSQMAHPNIVSVVDFVSLPSGTTFIVMELVLGRTLERAIGAEAPFTPQRAAHIARQIASGLGEAHRIGFVHRDVKPSNIMLSSEGSTHELVKVLDFGVVGLGQAPMSTRLTAIGHIIGTPTYMAPEQVHDPGVGPSADLYALGVILYEMLSGAPPFTGPGRTEILVKHISEPPPPLPPAQGLDQLALWLLEKRSDRRPRSAEEVTQAIDRLGFGARALEARRSRSAELRAEALAAPRAAEPELRPPIRGSASTSFTADPDTFELDTDSAIPRERVARALADTDPEREVPLVSPVEGDEPEAPARAKTVRDSSDDHFTSLSELPESLKEWASYAPDFMLEGGHPDPADKGPPTGAGPERGPSPRPEGLGSARIVAPLIEPEPRSNIRTFVVRERLTSQVPLAEPTAPLRGGTDLPTDVMLLEPELPPAKAGRMVDDGPTQVDFSLASSAFGSAAVSVTAPSPAVDVASAAEALAPARLGAPVPEDMGAPVISELVPLLDRTAPNPLAAKRLGNDTVLDTDTLDPTPDLAAEPQAVAAPLEAPLSPGGGSERPQAAITELDAAVEGKRDTLLDMEPPDFRDTLLDKRRGRARAPAVERRPLVGTPLEPAAQAGLVRESPRERVDVRLVILVLLMLGCVVLLFVLYWLYARPA